MAADAHRVLLIEDNPADVILFENMLRGVGTFRMEMDCAGRLSQGLEMLSEAAYDAVLLDLSLPESQGLETFELLNDQSLDIPVIVLTGFDDRDVAAQAVAMGAQDYVIKGKITGDALDRVLSYAVERHRHLSELERKNTELKASEDKLRRQSDIFANDLARTVSRFEGKVQELSVIRSVITAIEDAVDTNEVLRTACDTLLEETGGNLCTVVLLSKGLLDSEVIARGVDASLCEPLQVILGSKPEVKEDSVAPWVARNLQPISIPSVANRAVVRLYPDLDETGGLLSAPDLPCLPQDTDKDLLECIGSLLCIPFRVGRETVGVFALCHSRPDGITIESENVATLIVSLVSIAFKTLDIKR